MTSKKIFALCLLGLGVGACFGASSPGIRKLEDVVVYADPQFHNAFPSVVRRPDGELLVAFRRAPDRRLLGDAGYTHADPNSYLVMVRSTDNGRGIL